MNRSRHDIKGRKPNQPLGGSRVNIGDLERRRADTLVPVIRVSDSRKEEVVGNLPRRANNRNPGEDSRSGSRSQGGPSTGKELTKKKRNGYKLYIYGKNSQYILASGLLNNADSLPRDARGINPGGASRF